MTFATIVRCRAFDSWARSAAAETLIRPFFTAAMVVSSPPSITRRASRTLRSLTPISFAAAAWVGVVLGGPASLPVPFFVVCWFAPWVSVARVAAT